MRSYIFSDMAVCLCARLLRWSLCSNLVLSHMMCLLMVWCIPANCRVAAVCGHRLTTYTIHTVWMCRDCTHADDLFDFLHFLYFYIFSQVHMTYRHQRLNSLNGSHTFHFQLWWPVGLCSAERPQRTALCSGRLGKLD